MENEAREVTKLFDITVHIWTILEENEKVQQLEQQEENISIVIHELKKRPKKNEYYRVHEGHPGNEYVVDRVKGIADEQERKTRPIGTPLGTSIIDDCTARGR